MDTETESATKRQEEGGGLGARGKPEVHLRMDCPV